MKKLVVLLTSCLMISIVYSAGWYFMARKMGGAIDQFYYERALQLDINLYGPKPIISGFPFEPVIIYHKGFSTNNINITFPEMKIIGFPLPNFSNTIAIEKGARIKVNRTRYTMNIDSFRINYDIPGTFPKSSRRKDIDKWRSDVEKININNLEISKSQMNVTGSGYFKLDQELQPEVSLDSIIKGHGELVEFLISSGQLEAMPAMLAKAGLNSLTKIDPETNKAYVELNTRILNRTLFIGPVRITKFPRVRWTK